MAGLKQLRNRVKSIKSTQKITKAMQLVSAAKLKRIKERAEDLNDYSTVLSSIMYDISAKGNLMSLPLNDRKFFSDSLKDLPYLLVVITSERGLCGGFNSTVVKKVKMDVLKLQNEGKSVKLIVIGRKGQDALKSQYADIIVANYNIRSENSECVALQVRDKIIDMIENEECGTTFLYYNKFKNALTNIFTRQQILPAEATAEEKKQAVSEYEYEGENLVHQVIGLHIGGQINYGLLQSKAGEEGARMTAMDNATRNAGELMRKLTLKLNRSRQAIITTELTEIISGAEAL
jgi:F-type H+-transporting ATPase subunit gamma